MREMSKIKNHIIHCSDSDFGNVNVIRQWHLERGFRDVGYHFIIRRDGEIEVGRTLEETGAHCKGYNQESIGTCLIGKRNFEMHQFESLKRVHSMLKMIFPNIQVQPHNAFNKQKTCPNFNVEQVLGESG